MICLGNLIAEMIPHDRGGQSHRSCEPIGTCAKSRCDEAASGGSRVALNAASPQNWDSLFAGRAVDTRHKNGSIHSREPLVAAWNSSSRENPGIAIPVPCAEF